MPALPKDAASAAGRSTCSTAARPSGRIQGSEGQKVRLTQYARKVDAALRPILAGRIRLCSWPRPSPWPRFTGWSIASVDLWRRTVIGQSRRVSDADLAAAAREHLDRLYAAADASIFRTLYKSRGQSGPHDHRPVGCGAGRHFRGHRDPPRRHRRGGSGRCRRDERCDHLRRRTGQGQLRRGRRDRRPCSRPPGPRY